MELRKDAENHDSVGGFMDNEDRLWLQLMETLNRSHKNEPSETRVLIFCIFSYF